jgi:hypothetical protein
MSYSKEAVNYRWFEAVGAKIGPSWTTKQVCDNFIMKISKRSGEGMSHIQYLKRYYPDSPCPVFGLSARNCVRDWADIFLSHAWQYRFLDVLAALALFLEKNNLSKDNFYFWFDAAANDQHNAVVRSFHWWQTVFLEAIREIRHTLLIIIPWDRATVLSRAWCLWEIYCTHVSNAKLTLQLHERRPSIVSGTSLYGVNPDRSLVIDISACVAFKKEDQDMILEAVRRVGFKEVNRMIKMKMISALASAGFEEHRRDIPDQGPYGVCLSIKEIGSVVNGEIHGNVSGGFIRKGADGSTTLGGGMIISGGSLHIKGGSK